MKSSFIALLLSAGLANATSFYYSFCDDCDCSQNCGVAVSATNPGCVAEGGRQSAKITYSSGGDVNYPCVAGFDNYQCTGDPVAKVGLPSDPGDQPASGHCFSFCNGDKDNYKNDYTPLNQKAAYQFHTSGIPGGGSGC